MYAEKSRTLFCLCSAPRSAGEARRAGGIHHPNTAGTRHHRQAEPAGACRARRASRGLGPWRLQGSSTEGEGARRFRAERRPSSGLSVLEERVGRGNLAPLGRACPVTGAPLFPGPAGGTPGRAPPRGGGGRAGASPENGACGGRAGSEPRSQALPPAFTALGGGADSRGAFSRTEDPSPGRPADCPRTECGARPRPGWTRRWRILGPAAGSAGAAWPDAASQTGLARERTREPRESLAAPRGGRPNLRSLPSRRRDPGAQVGRAGEGVVGREGLGGEFGGRLYGRGH